MPPGEPALRGESGGGIMALALALPLPELPPALDEKDAWCGPE